MMVGGEGAGVGVVPMSDVSFNKYPCCLSLKVLDKYYYFYPFRETEKRMMA